MVDPTERFTSRVEHYSKYRPSYPQEVVMYVERECGLSGESVIADVGSGTGILSELWLKKGCAVFGIEPNERMRKECELLLRDYKHFTSVDASAEETTLAAESVDFVTAGQAFHWFDQEAARKEFSRILKPSGWVVLIWNNRRTVGTPFLEKLERLLQTFGTDYETVARAVNENTINKFFGKNNVRQRSFENKQILNRAGARGRLLSMSYTPQAEDPRFIEMLNDFDMIFDRHERNGCVSIEYDTTIYCGQLQ